ncbi:uncharacterized protein LY89DRAFT_686037 [Mollisia scopiformis]|uniref:Uncharacterized protein n=1 Tax=Mollisia scopiformis TaxID=149040 RepID=A0A194X502_MOLSC|nr:uncharacterized protein LY89DRAFT_686037 [Mollisia scopiformis]KUJ15255.1 hypothetical protein LY89DRAFT_686037 [Mollisia scopiformis]
MNDCASHVPTLRPPPNQGPFSPELGEFSCIGHEPFIFCQPDGMACMVRRRRKRTVGPVIFYSTVVMAIRVPDTTCHAMKPPASTASPTRLSSTCDLQDEPFRSRLSCPPFWNVGM